VDVGRQVMSDIAQQKLHAELRAAFAAKDGARFKAASDAYCEAIMDCDRLLSSHAMFQFGRYLKYPLAAEGTAERRGQWEGNARRLITLWGGSGNSLFGYAQRQYGGLMRDYNLASWKLYLDAAAKSLRGSEKFSGDSLVRDFTEKWIQSRKTYPAEAEGDPVVISRMIWEKYAAHAPKVTRPGAPLDINDKE